MRYAFFTTIFAVILAILTSCVSAETAKQLDSIRQDIKSIEKGKAAGVIAPGDAERQIEEKRVELEKVEAKAAAEKKEGWATGLDVAGTAIDWGSIFFSGIPIAALILGPLGKGLKTVAGNLRGEPANAA